MAPVSEDRSGRFGDDADRLRKVFDHAAPTLVIGPDDDIVEVSGRACELLDRQSEELLSRTLEDICAEPSGVVREFVDEASSDGPVPATVEWTTPDGETISTFCSGSAVEIGGQTYVVVTLRARKTGRERAGQVRHDSTTDARADGAALPDASDGPDDDSRPYERRLEALDDASRELAAVETREGIARTALDVCRRVLGVEISAARLFDEETGTLERVALTDEAESLVDAVSAFDLGATFAGRAYRRGEPVFDDVDDPATVGAAERSSLHLPLGNHGTLTLCPPTDSPLTGHWRRLAERVAATVTAELDRAEREEILRQRKRAARRQRDRFERLHDIDALVQRLIGDLLDADDRAEIDRTVCRHVASSSPFRGALIADVDATMDEITVRTSAGLAADAPDVLDEFAVSTVVEETTVRRVGVDETRPERAVGGRESGDARAGESVATAPLTHADHPCGVLVVFADEADAFGDRVRSGLEVLGTVIGFAVNAVRRRDLLLSDEVAELEFEVTDCSCLAVGVSDALGCRCLVERSVPTADGKYLSYLRIEDMSADTGVEAVERLESVVDCRVVAENDGDCLLEVIRSECGSEVMVEHGATMRTATAEDGTGTLVIESPETADIRRIVEAYQQWNPGSELVAKRTRTRPVRTATEFRERIDERLTNKQRRAMETAYSAGYYEWPRESTAQELADALGISSATFHQHLRASERKLLTAFFDERERGVRPGPG